MTGVDAILEKHKNCKDRDELLRLIKEYKNQALQHASNLVLAAQYSTVALRLQEICDKLPAQNIIKQAAHTPSVPVKTANITNEEQKKIDADWRKKTKK
jgi:hypothetical protein